jgi:hypothetical protein
MKSLVTILALLSTTLLTNAQDSWKIMLNKKAILISNESNELLNTKKIKSADWKSNGYLEVSFKEKNPSNWLHSLQFSDEQGNLVLVKDSTTTAKVPIASLRKLFKGKKQIKIYMIINPPNPMMMAPSRMLHLGTLKLP